VSPSEPRPFHHRVSIYWRLRPGSTDNSRTCNISRYSPQNVYVAFRTGRRQSNSVDLAFGTGRRNRFVPAELRLATTGPSVPFSTHCGFALFRSSRGWPSICFHYQLLLQDSRRWWLRACNAKNCCTARYVDKNEGFQFTERPNLPMQDESKHPDIKVRSIIS
jgi:hypothetical protein